MKAVLFDWDGVLLDSVKANFNVYQKILSKLGLPLLDYETFRAMQSPQWYDFYEKVGIPRERWRDTDKMWLGLYRYEKPRLYNDAKNVLHKLTSVGVKTALLSNGVRSRVARELAKFDLESFFDVVICGDDVMEKKPSPKMILLTLERLGVASMDAVYVGDCPEDVMAAKAAGVVSVALTRGFSSREKLKVSEPDFLLKDLAEFLETFHRVI